MLITGAIAPLCPCGKGCADVEEYIQHARHCAGFKAAVAKQEEQRAAD